jgi:uncharacterized oligopeptide transporter (OPT) family protein
MTGGGNMAAYGALLMVLAAQPALMQRPSTLALILWFAVIAALGVFAAIPIKRQLINQEAWRSPPARPPPRRSLAAQRRGRRRHPEGRGAGDRRGVGGAGRGGCATPRLMDAADPAKMPIKLAGHELKVSGRSRSRPRSMLIGAGALMSFRTGWSLLLGAVVTYGVIAPLMSSTTGHQGPSATRRSSVDLWPGAASWSARASRRSCSTGRASRARSPA